MHVEDAYLNQIWSRLADVLQFSRSAMHGQAKLLIIRALMLPPFLRSFMCSCSGMPPAQGHQALWSSAGIVNLLACLACSSFLRQRPASA